MLVDDIMVFLEKYQMMLSMVIVVAGWYFTYRFNNKVQDRRLRNDIVNTARQEITKACREYQHWLNSLHSHLTWVTNNNYDRSASVDSDFNKWNDLREQRFMTWNALLEDYAILFPETKKIRVQLQDRDIEIGQLLMNIHMSFLAAKHEGLTKPLQDLLKSTPNNAIEYISDQMCLMIDLNVYMQNRCLGEITGNKIQPRSPRDTTVPKIVIKNGVLEIENNVVGITAIGRLIQDAKKEYGYPY